MSRTRQSAPFTTFEEFVLSVPSGQTALLVIERKEVLHQVYPLLFNSLPVTRKSLLVSNRPWQGRSLQPETIRQKGKALSALQQRIRAVPAGSLLFFDLPDFWRARPALLADFIQSTGRIAVRKKIAVLWIVSPALEGPDLARIKPDLIAQIALLPGSQALAFHLFFTREPLHPSLSEVRRVESVKNRIVFSGVMDPPEARPDGGVSFTLFEDLFRSSTDGLLLFQPEGTMRLLNDAGGRILDLEGEDPDDTTLVNLIPPAERVPALRILASIRMAKPVQGRVRIHKSNNRLVHLEVSAFPVYSGLWCARFQDKTPAFRMEKDTQRGYELFKSLFEGSLVPQALYSERKLLYHNSSFAALGTHLGGQARLATLSRLLGKENRNLYREILTLGEDQDRRCDLHLTNEAGARRSYLFMLRRVLLEGKSGFLCSFLDTTREWEQSEALKQQYDELRSLLEYTPQPILAVSGTTIGYANSALANLLGYAGVIDLIGKKIHSIVGAKGKAKFLRILSSTAAEGEPTSTECVITRSDGSTIEVRAALAPGVMEGKAVVLIAITDRTEEKAGEEKTRAAIAVREFLLDLDTAFSSSMDIEEMLAEGLRIWMRALHCECGGLFLVSGDGLSLATSSGLPEKLRTMLTADDHHGGLVGLILKTAEPLALRINQYPPHIPYRSVFEAEGIAHAFCIPLLSGDEVVGIVVLASSKQVNPVVGSEESLRAASARCGRLMANGLRHKAVVSMEERFRHTLEALPNSVYRTNSRGLVTYVSPNIRTLTLYEPGTITRSPELMRQMVHPDDRTLYGKKFAGGAGKPERQTLEYRILPKGEAAYRWVQDSVLYRYDQDGNVESIIGSLRDITEERSHMDVLARSEELKANVLESIGEGVAVYDLDLKCREWNSAMEQITGLTRSEVLGHSIGQTTLHVVSQELVGMLQSALSGKTVSSDDIILNRGKTGSTEEYYWVRCVPLLGQDEAIRGVVLTFTNVSARRALEQSVRESEETLRNVIDGMGDALMISDLQGRVWEVNKEFTRITGYTRREVLGMIFPYPWLVEEEMARFVSWIAELRERSYLRDFDMTWHSREGSDVAISINTSLLRNAAGEPVAMLNIARDISDRKRLMTELERRNRELETLNDVSTSISKSLRVDDVLTVAGEKIRQLMDARIVLLYLKDRRNNRLSLGSHAGLSDEESEHIRQLHPSESATGAVISQGTPLLINSGLMEDTRISKEGREILNILGLNSLGVIPLRSKEIVLGALDVGFNDDHHFTDEEKQFLTLIGNQLGSAIENAQLYDEVRKQVTRLTSLYEVGRGLTGSLDLKAILSTVYDEIRRAIPGDRFCYFEYNDQRGTLETMLDRSLGEGTASEPPTGEQLRKNLTPLDKTFSEGKPMFVQCSEPSVSMIVAPVRSGQTVAGLLVVAGYGTELEDEAHLRLLESIANLTEIALEKASLYEDIVTKSREIENRNKELDDFTYVVSHDLKEPLISIEGYSKILLKEYQTEIGDSGKIYLSSLVNSSTRLKNLIDDLLTLSRLGRVSEAVDHIPLDAVVNDVLQDIQFTLQEANATVEIEGSLPKVLYNPTQLGMVIRNLISNAIKFNDKPAPRVVLRCTNDGSMYHVSVSDNGIGIEEVYFDKIFMIFQRLHRTEEYRGTGAGLTIVRKIVENHGGTVTVTSVPGEGSTFTFTIPQSQQ